MANNVWIPRNLTEEDSIKFPLGIRLKMSDLPFMCLSTVATSQFTNGLEDIYKYGVYMSGFIGTYYLMRISYQGQSLVELILNGVVYNSRKQNYKKRGK